MNKSFTLQVKLCLDLRDASCILNASHNISIQFKLYFHTLQGNEMCIRSAEYYLYEQEELSFYDIMVRARQRKEIVIGYRLASTDQAIINPENKSEVRTWSLDDVFIVISNDD